MLPYLNTRIFQIFLSFIKNHERIKKWLEFLATDPEARVRFPALPDFLGRKKKKRKTVVGLERGPLSLVSTTEELLDRKAISDIKNHKAGLLRFVVTITLLTSRIGLVAYK
jgi:hypothetical protein